MNATLGTPDASGDLLEEGDQSPSFDAVGPAGERDAFARSGLDVSFRQVQIAQALISDVRLPLRGERACEKDLVSATQSVGQVIWGCPDGRAADVD